MMGVFIFKQVAEEDLPTGEVNVQHGVRGRWREAGDGWRGDALIDDDPSGKGRMDHTVPIRFSGYAGMDIGRDNGGVVDLSYEAKKPFAFTGTVKKVVFDIMPHLSADDDAISTPRRIRGTPGTHCRASRRPQPEGSLWHWIARPLMR